MKGIFTYEESDSSVGYSSASHAGDLGSNPGGGSPESHINERRRDYQLKTFILHQFDCLAHNDLKKNIYIYIFTSPESQNIFDAEFFSPIEMSGDLFFCGQTASDVKHGLHATVVEHGAGDCCRARRFIWGRIACGMPRHITEQRVALPHAVKSEKKIIP